MIKCCLSISFLVILRPPLGVPCANIIIIIEDRMTREHKLRKRLGFILFLNFLVLHGLPDSFHATRCVTFAEWHRNTPMRIEWNQLHQSILSPACHICQYRIRIFLQYRRSLDLWARLHSQRAVAYPPFTLGKTDASTVLFSLNRSLLPFRLDDNHNMYLDNSYYWCPIKKLS